jgi:integrase
VRARIEKILDWCVTNKYRPEGANPARWRGHLENLLPKPGKVTKAKHHDSLPWQEAPEFMSKLVLDTGIPGTAAAFAILTCTRASEAAGARWPEIDLGARTWTIPAERMKAGETHRVPLTAGALAILHRMAQIKSNSDDRLFLARSGRLRAQSMLKAVQRVHEGITLHGFRSTFRVWAREMKKDWAASELALAHDVRTKTQAAYDRGDRLEERRPIMEDWAAFIAT